jgi:hypothetical protein
LSSKTPRTDAEAKFARTQKRATDAARAVSDAVAEAKRIDENTARLRALRLERDARMAAARAAAPPAPPAKGKAKPKAGAAAKVVGPVKAAAVGKGIPKADKAMPVRKRNAGNGG